MNSEKYTPQEALNSKVENIDTDEKWTKDGFSIENEIKLRHGPFIEIGGPTTHGFKLIDFDSLLARRH